LLYIILCFSILLEGDCIVFWIFFSLDFITDATDLRDFKYYIYINTLFDLIVIYLY
jgi:hypothetical protein